MTIKLAVSKRTGNNQALRAAGLIPAVVYGPKVAPLSIAVDKVLFTKTLEAAGESTILNLVGLDQEMEVLIHDVAFNAARGGIEHADFYAIEAGKELTTHVSIEFIGEAPITKSGASLNKNLHELEITCRPADLPAHITVDVSGLATEDAHILVKDIVAPKGVTINNDAELVVVNIAAARKEEVDEPVAAPEVPEATPEAK